MVLQWDALFDPAHHRATYVLVIALGKALRVKE